MSIDKPSFAKGLEGVTAAESEICKIDGVAGLLSYRGYRIEDIVEKYDFENVTYLLLKNTLPNGVQERQYIRTLRENRALSDRTIDCIRTLPKDMRPMDMLQCVVPVLAAEHYHDGQTIPVDGIGCEHLIAQLATAVAAIYHTERGTEIITPCADLNHGENFLYMLHGKKPSKIAGQVMDTCFTLHAEHGLNASTFAARVISSTLAHCYSSVSGAIGCLSGALHGGANEKVIQMVDQIGDVQHISAWLDDALAQKKKIMGMGHRVYKTKDPRALIIEKLLAVLNQELPHSNDYPMLKKIEEQFDVRMREKGKPLYPNVDFFSGAAYRMLGIPPHLFTPIFAIARVSGWMAHIREQAADNRIYRPKLHYIGREISVLP